MSCTPFVQWDFSVVYYPTVSTVKGKRVTKVDLVLKNGNIITFDPYNPQADIIGIKDDRILFTGKNEDLDSITGSDIKIIDCEGKTVVPGFNDAHCHIFSFLRKLISVDLSERSVRSIDDIKATIKRKAIQTPAGEWISGTDYNDFYLAEKRHPNRRELDEVAPNHPVVLSHRSLHACVLNSKALSLAGITRETEEPPGGHIDRELDTGEPSGLLIDMLGFIREEVMPSISETELEKGIKLTSEHYLSNGITSLQDATVVNDYTRWQRFCRFKEKQLLKSRLYYMPGVEYFEEFVDAGVSFCSGDTHLKIGHVKITPSETREKRIHPSQPELNKMVLDIHQAGYRAAIHATRYETVESAVNAIENALVQLPQPEHRHRIEHCSECPPHLLDRIRKLGIMVVTQPPFLYYSGERYMATVPSDRQPWLYRIKSMIEAGIPVAGSSDSPIVDDNPLVGIYAAVNRLAASGQEVLTEERISVKQALEIYTRNAAYASFEEKEKGTINEGKFADLVLLSDDPTTVPSEQLKDIKVEMTIVGGKVVWER
ncbi:MAG TPA: amidohydrolase [Dehalococcoidia bacterium]|nr:amidohydrolase [Dehalococcoidia bacterium]